MHMFMTHSWRVGVLVALLWLMPVFVFAQGGLPKAIVPENCQGANAAQKCGVCDLAQLAQNVVNTAIFLAVILSAILFAWAGFKLMSGNPGQISQGKGIFANVIIGLVIILAAYLLVDTLFSIMTGEHVWAQVC